MFSRSVLRAAQPLRMHARCFATETGSGASPPGGGGGSNSLLYVIGATAVGGGGLYYLYDKNYGGSRIGGSRIGDGSSSGGKGGQSATSAAKAAFTGGDQGFLSLRLAEVIDVNHNTKRFRFELPEMDQVPGLPITSAVLARFKGPNDEKATLRPYTPINDENEPGHLELLVKKYPNGPMSTHIHDLQPGQTLDIKGPLPKYPWTANKHDHVALVAGGTGITPMFQLARAIFHDSADTRTQVTLVFGNVGPDDVLLRRELDELENTHPRRFRAFYVLDRPPPEWQGGRGPISRDLLRTVLPEPGSGNVKIFVCGPPGLMKAISGPKVSPRDQGELSGILKELGYDKEQVYKF